jgi:hypothetical protein
VRTVMCAADDLRKFSVSLVATACVLCRGFAGKAPQHATGAVAFSSPALFVAKPYLPIFVGVSPWPLPPGFGGGASAGGSASLAWSIDAKVGASS